MLLLELWSQEESHTGRALGAGTDLHLLGEAKAAHLGGSRLEAVSSWRGCQEQLQRACGGTWAVPEWDKSQSCEPDSVVSKERQRRQQAAKWLHGREGRAGAGELISVAAGLSCAEVRRDESRGKRDVRRSLLPAR